MAELPGVVVVFAAGAGRETCREVSVSAGSTVADAIKASGLASLHPEVDFDTAPTGIWGRPVSRSLVLSTNDRVEIYRHLTVDPKVARMRRVQKKRSSRKPGELTG
jgi:hypothetical protein